MTINEAVELAKGFGGEDDSPRFVNGVLGQIARSLEAEGAADAVGSPAEEPAAGDAGGGTGDRPASDADGAAPMAAEGSEA